MGAVFHPICPGWATEKEVDEQTEGAVEEEEAKEVGKEMEGEVVEEATRDVDKENEGEVVEEVDGDGVGCRQPHGRCVWLQMVSQQNPQSGSGAVTSMA